MGASNIVHTIKMQSVSKSTIFGLQIDGDFFFNPLLQILLGRGDQIDFSSQLKFAKIEFYGAFHL